MKNVHKSIGAALLLSVWLVSSTACMGAIGDAPGGESEARRGGAAPFAGDPAEHLVEVGLTRLSPYEYDNTVRDLLGALSRPSEEVLPRESTDDPHEDFAFDTYYEYQQVSATLIGAVETLAVEAAAGLVGDPTRRDAVVGCTPSGPGDAACFREFLSRFGQRAFRRPLSLGELDSYETLLSFAVEANDFDVAVEAAVSAMLMSPSFLYRVELGTPLPDASNVFRLGGYEVASRLSYLLWGTMPDDALLAAAEAGELETGDGVRSAAERLLDDPRAERQVARFHAQWLGYEPLPHDDAIGSRMRRETDALITRVVFDERRPWSDLFTMRETFVDDTLAAHYGMTPVGSDEPTWVAYEDRTGGRGGILSHGSFLSVGRVGDDPSPMKRGHRISTTLLCNPIPPPPPNIDTDLGATSEDAECQQDRNRMHAQGGCAGCHQFMDPIGFGLDQYDALGRFRLTETDRPECEVSGVGHLPSIGGAPESDFTGPAELGELLADGRVQRCVATQFFRFAVRRNVRGAVGSLHAIHEEDLPLLDYLGDRFAETDDFRSMVLEIVTSPFFTHRIATERIATEETTP